MLFANITLLAPDYQVQENMYVGIQGSRIAYVGPQKPAEDFGEVYDGRGRLLMSAFYNTHAHTPMAILRGYGENMVLADWLNQLIFPFEDCLTGDDIYTCTLLGIAEMVRYGIVCATDMYMQGERMAQAFLESGCKCNLSVGVTDFEAKGFYQLPAYAQSKNLWENYHLAQDGLLRVEMSIHGEYTSCPRTVAEVAEFCQKVGAHCHIHLGETQAERDGCLERQGKCLTAYFRDLGVFAVPTTAAHCVWLTEEDFAILAQQEGRVTVATCPVSNLKLASGVCNVPRLLELGVPVALGTDSVSSNNNLNMVEEMKVLALIHKGVSYDPTLITPRQALSLATQAGALAQGRPDCGSVQVGNRADLIVMRIDGPHMQPCFDLCNNLVYAADGQDVCLTMADGRVLYRNGEFLTIDIEKVVAKVNAIQKRILGQLAAR